MYLLTALEFQHVGGFAHLSFSGCKYIYNFKSVLGLDTDCCTQLSEWHQEIGLTLTKVYLALNF